MNNARYALSSQRKSSTRWRARWFHLIYVKSSLGARTYGIKILFAFIKPKSINSKKMEESLLSQAKRMMNACHKLVALASTCKKPNSSSTMMRKEEKPKQIATTSKPQDKKENPRVDDNRNKENLIKTAHIKDRASHDNADYIDRPKRNLQTTHGERRNLKERFNGK